MLSQTLLFTLAIITLFALFFVSSFLFAARRQRKEIALSFLPTHPRKKNLENHPNLYFRLHQDLFGNKITTLLFCLTLLQNTLRALYLLFAYAALLQAKNSSMLPSFLQGIDAAELILSLFAAVVTFIVFGDLIPRYWTTSSPQKSLKTSSPLASCFLFLFLPYNFLFYQVVRLFVKDMHFSPFGDISNSPKDQLLDAIRDADEHESLNEHDKKLLQSVFTFQDRIAREVMVPRVNLSCISEDATITEAAKLFEKEEYSRVPVYKNTIDTIVGVLMYKDILLEYIKPETNHTKSIQHLVKGVIFAPETKKLSQLLQEFRKKQTHIAIVVDEYGGTAGIVTIEDILEEIVGEIADEYDKETSLFRPAGKGAWVVDARMNLLDLEEELGIQIPQEGEYDTIAGYIFYCLGTIPKKGARIHQDEFEIEILESRDRVVEKVKITPSLRHESTFTRE